MLVLCRKFSVGSCGEAVLLEAPMAVMCVVLVTEQRSSGQTLYSFVFEGSCVMCGLPHGKCVSVHAFYPGMIRHTLYSLGMSQHTQKKI